jgi:hypothetical protein
MHGMYDNSFGFSNDEWLENAGNVFGLQRIVIQVSMNEVSVITRQSQFEAAMTIHGGGRSDRKYYQQGHPPSIYVIKQNYCSDGAPHAH